MDKVDNHRKILRNLEDWDSFLLEESGLPGKRANIELAQAVAEEGEKELFERYLSFDPEKAPVNSPQELLAFCGVLGLGKLISEGKRGHLKTLRQFVSDPRWRIREAVTMALQRFGLVDIEALLEAMEKWSKGNPWEKRAAAAALCEPKLLSEKNMF